MFQEIIKIIKVSIHDVSLLKIQDRIQKNDLVNWDKNYMSSNVIIRDSRRDESKRRTLLSMTLIDLSVPMFKLQGIRNNYIDPATLDIMNEKED